MAKHYHVYIMTNVHHTTLYVGVTGNMLRRYAEHQLKLGDGFTSKYQLVKLVHCEPYTEIEDAITREKQLKKWSRTKKEGLIGRENPGWEDLGAVLLG